MRLNFNKKEIVHLVLSTLLLTALLSFSYASSNIAIIRILLVVAISLLATILTQKLIGLKYNQEVEYRIWSLKESEETPKNIIKNIFNILYSYAGLIIPVFIFFITNSLWVFLAVATFITIHPIKNKIGRKYPFLEEKEVAAISFFGILAYLVVASILYIITGNTSQIEARIPLLLAIYALIPIPNLPGSKLFFGRRVTYFFTLGLAISLFILLPQVSPIYSIVISAVFAVTAGGLYLYAVESGIKEPFSVEGASITVGWRLLFMIILIAVMLLLSYFFQARIISMLAFSIIIATLAILIYYYLIEVKK